MRQMTNGKTTLNIVEHIILKNFWEYYLTDYFPVEGNTDIREAFIMGFENELGDVSLEEIRPYILTRTKELNEIMPAQGWSWK